MSFALSPYHKEAKPLPQKSIAFGAVTSSYVLVGSLFQEGIITLILVSTFDETVQISLDGVVDFMPMIAGGTFVLDMKANKAALGGYRGVYVKQIGDPTEGSLYVSTIGVE